MKKESCVSFFACKNRKGESIIPMNLVTNRDDCMQLFYVTCQEEGFSYGVAGFSYFIDTDI